MSIVQRVRQIVRRVPAMVWSVTALHVMLLLAYSVLLPTYRAPDEPQHVDLAHFVSEEQEYPAWDDRDLGPGVFRSLFLAEFFAPRSSSHLTEAEAVPKTERPSFEDLEEPARETGVNQLPQHPPLYYLVAGGVEYVAELAIGDPSYDLETWIFRLVSIMLVAPLPLIIWGISRRLRFPPAVGIAATLVPLCIPQFIHISSAVNNDSLLMLSFWLLTPVIIRLAGGDLSPRTALLAGTLTSVGLLTKGFALVLPLWVLGALLTAWRREPSRRTDVFRAGAFYSLTTLFGAAWWLRNLIVFGELSPSRFSELLPNRDDVEVKLGDFAQAWAYRTTRRFWGDFGWFDVHIPALAFGAATIIFLVAMAVACLRRDRIAGTSLGDRLLVGAPFLLLLFTQIALAFRGYVMTGNLPGLQGRYWYGAMAGIAVLVALGLANIVRRVEYLPLAVLAAVVAMQAIGITTLLDHYWGWPGSSLATQLRGLVAWAPLPGELLGVGALLGAAAFTATAVNAVLQARRPPDPETPAPTAVESVAAAT